MSIRFAITHLINIGNQLDHKYFKHYHAHNHHHHYWQFHWAWQKHKHTLAQKLHRGRYGFQPLIGSIADHPIEPRWRFEDRWALRCIWLIIKPTLKHIISKHCLHLQGPNGVYTAHTWITNVLKAKPYHYILRLDIKGYYASINHQILYQQLQDQFDDPRLLRYFKDIVFYDIERFGYSTPAKQGIPRQSSLSGFFAALYLSPLDQCFENRTGMCYLRYNDDIIILTQSKRQYAKAKRDVNRILSQLKLSLSKSKSYMGPIKHGFHFLGYQYTPAVLHSVPRSRSEHQVTWKVSLHRRTFHRAIDKALSSLIPIGMNRCHFDRLSVDHTVWHQCHGPPRYPYSDPSMRMFIQQLSKQDNNLMQTFNVLLHSRFDGHPSSVQKYLYQWLSWWTRKTDLDACDILKECAKVLKSVEPALTPKPLIASAPLKH